MSEVKSKLEISGKTSPEITNASYKPIPEQDMEEQVAASTRPKSVVKLKIGSSTDGESERMLPDDEKISEVVVCNNDMKSPQNGDAKLDIAEPPNKQAFVGLTKEELMQYANDPFWVRLRWFLFVTFWLLWAAMLVGAILIIYAAPKCDPPAPRTWYEKGPLAQLTSDDKLQELQLDENIQGMIVPWWGDIYQPLENNQADLERLKLAKKASKRVIVEFDPTWSNLWFAEAEKKNPEFEGYYIWASGTDNKPPNNWVNPNNTTSWKFSTVRNQFYYAPFDQPHLNFNNSSVVNQFKRVIDEFLRVNVSGIRLRHASFLLIDRSLSNLEIYSNANPSYGIGQYSFYEHSKTEDLPEVGKLLYQWRAYLRKKTTCDEEVPLMVAEELAKVESYKVNQTLAVDMPLLTTIFSRPTFNVNETLSNLNYSLKINNLTWPLWEAKTKSVPRDVLHIITYLLPGAPLINATEKVNPDLLKIRNNPSIMRYGNDSTFEVYGLQNNTVMSFIRVTPGSPGILVVVNPTDNLVTTNLSAEIYKLSSIQEVTVSFYSENYNISEFKDIGSKHASDIVPISPKSAIVLEYVPKKDE
ncbi:neutral and basic amino acid transport protein rBAT [Anthonomus grandis grandis]|uniref:neutral and basic amino acid transport protein rBAT n=1 Tax=Anthonomus grandis grandis TaxID=2921223 RepID=UPI0021665B22|nr:neutral and basic amino acid transport protein rBAT [Anthonomus grandis grandis]